MSEESDSSPEDLFFGAPVSEPVVVPYDTVVDAHPEDNIDDEIISDEEIKEAPKGNPFLSGTSNKRPAPDEVLETKRHKRFKINARIPGGHVPTFKPITINLDAEDQLIVDMKGQGHSEEAIVNRLIEKGFTRYQHRSIQCRLDRIRKKAQEYEEKLLDEELTDWHLNEDELLREAVESAEAKFQTELEKLEIKRWVWTARDLNARLPRQRFSANACRDRFEALENGTARLPPELDSDPEGRQREREQRLADFKQRKEDEARREAAEAAAQKQHRRENTAQKIAARERKEAQAQIRAQKKQEEESYRQAKATAAEEAKQRKQSALGSTRTHRRYDEKKYRIFDKVQRRLRKEANALEKKKARNGGILPDDEDPNFVAKSRYAYKNTMEEIENTDYSAIEAAINARAHQFAGVVQAVGVVPQTVMPMTKRAVRVDDDGSGSTDIFGEDPRAMCTIKELYDVLRQRKMLLNRMKECKPIILSRLRNEDSTASVAELKQLLLDRGETDTDGNKDDLIRRLAIADAMTSQRYKNKYTNRPLDERGNRTKVKTPAKQSTKRYNAREAETDTENAPAKKILARKTSNSKTLVNTPTKKTPARKAPVKASEKIENLSEEFVHDEDDEDPVDEQDEDPVDEQDIEHLMTAILN